MDHQKLGGVPLFAGMDDTELRQCAAAFEETRALMGERLTTVDDFGYSFFIVLSGRVRVDIGGETVAQLGAGDHFGEVALVSGQRRNATVSALETCDLAKIMVWDFQQLTSEHPTLASRVRQAAADRSQPEDGR